MSYFAINILEITKQDKRQRVQKIHGCRFSDKVNWYACDAKSL
jgi:hypothetical protein